MRALLVLLAAFALGLAAPAPAAGGSREQAVLSADGCSPTPNLRRRHGSDIYVLMYDVYGAKPHNNMGFSKTRDFIHFRDIGRFNDPGSPMKATNFSAPKHGAVMPISPDELQRLTRHFARACDCRSGFRRRRGAALK